MTRDLSNHQKIRFRRDEIVDLGALPSACDQSPPMRSRAPRRRRRLLGGLAAVVAVISVVVAVTIFSANLLDFGEERIRAQAERAFSRMVGVPVVASYGGTGLSLGRSHLLSLEISDVSVVRARDRYVLMKAGSVRFQLQLLPLLRGRIELGSATLADATIAAEAMPKPSGRDWTATLRRADGLFDPDRVLDAAFEGTRRVLDGFEATATDTVRLSNVSIELPAAAFGQSIDIADASLSLPEPGRLALALDGITATRPFTVAMSASRNDTGRIGQFAMDLTLGEAETVVADVSGASAAVPAVPGHTLGAVTIRLSGSEAEPGAAPHLNLSGTARGMGVDFGRHGVWTGDIDIGATLQQGAGKLEINRLNVVTGRSRLDFNGAVGPQPAVDSAAPKYRFELVSQSSILAPVESPESALQIKARAGGTYDPAALRFEANDIALTGGAGEALGMVAVQFEPGKSPGLSLALSAAGMPVAHVKQIWPWFSAAPARRWLLSNVYGGRVVEGRVVMGVPPGRLGNGVPLNGSEVWGDFVVEDTRFDVTGRMPPVRDAYGSVNFRGADIDVKLDSGTMYMPSGRTVAGRNGTLTIRDANKRPVIGDLEIDVSGDAPAVAELSAYEPINALEKIGLAADDFSGTVEGRVRADIPLHAGIPREDLDWRVEFSYRDLALAKSFDGQLLTDAAGTIVVDKARAVIAAKGRLNGVPAEIELTEPLVKDAAGRSRVVEMELDDKARQQFAPGLDGLVAGPVKLSAELLDGGERRVVADLKGATMSVPWANWSKGPGIPAEVSFTMTPDGAAQILRDFRVAGASFSAEGTVRLANGLESAELTRVRLNRGDDARLQIKRTGRGYSVGIRGSSVDARSLIKLYVAGEGGEGDDGGSGGTAVTIDMDVARLGGFGEEALSAVSFKYSGSGGESGSFRMSARTDTGADVNAVNTVEGGRRNLTLQSGDAGAVARFLDIYPHVQGGSMNVALSGDVGGALRGNVEARNFFVVNEPRLSSLVATPPPGSDRSLNQVVRREVDVSKAQFERGFAQIDKGTGYLKIANGVLRGPMIGSTFQGTLYDADGNMDMTGTFMPAYGLNRLFGELPLIGEILGNGRDRGLIGVTYRLSGKADSPTLQVNPLSVIAPGIFRSIFEY